MNGKRIKGVIAKYDVDRGYGFISWKTESGQRASSFFHVSRCHNLVPEIGLAVNFVLDHGKKGLMASGICAEKVSPVIPTHSKFVTDLLDAATQEVEDNGAKQ